ncbi:hypothetical protein CcCBS67573_g02511 [Chytriomyces confervae]|uniref:Homeobox domain-containing protein n=1 Tax=Chytriomyces confervae TaxID=246404 RepID=A0A507FJ18_9FUNG|nr:hypothetical protein CcCBS67573_g02511 [Chytriomyces confervae]
MQLLQFPSNGYAAQRRFSVPAASSPTSLFFEQLTESSSAGPAGMAAPRIPMNLSIPSMSHLTNVARRMSLPVSSMSATPPAPTANSATTATVSPTKLAQSFTFDMTPVSLSPTKLADSFNANLREMMASYNSIMFPEAPQESSVVALPTGVAAEYTMSSSSIDATYPQYSFPPETSIMPDMTRPGSTSPEQAMHGMPMYQIPLQPQDLSPSAPSSPPSYTASPSPQSSQKRLQEFIDPNNIKKNNRFKAKDNDLKCLMAVFEKNPFPSTALRLSLAKKLNLEAKQVQFWFQNRRATLKMNGIHVVKPKQGAASGKPGLVPLSQNGYFYAEEPGMSMNVALNEDGAQFVASL